MKPADRVQLWEFNDNVTRLGEASGAGIAALVQHMDEPAGGTEVGRAFAAVAANSRTRNVIVITDGLSWALDPRRIKGLRVTTVLIGENALEAGVGALATITGGQVFVAAGSDAAAAIVAAFDAARAAAPAPNHRRQPIAGGGVRSRRPPARRMGRARRPGAIGRDAFGRGAADRRHRSYARHSADAAA